MDLNSVPKLVGNESKERFAECMSVLTQTRWPLYLVGPSGSGKSVMAMNLAKGYSIRHDVPAYYLQLSPDQTKTSVILGLRLINGSLTPMKGVVAEAMSEGGIVIVDECTHSTQELLLMFNSILDRTSITSIGDMLVEAEDTFRVVFCSNDSSYAGNVRLPQSFAQRLVTFKFDYPSAEEEMRIAQRIAEDEFTGTFDVPQPVLNYVTAFMREMRTPSFPLSARNIAIAVIRLAIVKKDQSGKTDQYFSESTHGESIRRSLAKRALGYDVDSSTSLQDPRVVEFIKYVSSIGVQRFKDIILSSCMYYIDVDGTELQKDTIRQKIASSII